MAGEERKRREGRESEGDGERVSCTSTFGSTCLLSLWQKKSLPDTKYALPLLPGSLHEICIGRVVSI